MPASSDDDKSRRERKNIVVWLWKFNLNVQVIGRLELGRCVLGDFIKCSQRTFVGWDKKITFLSNFFSVSRGVIENSETCKRFVRLFSSFLRSDFLPVAQFLPGATSWTAIQIECGTKTFWQLVKQTKKDSMSPWTRHRTTHALSGCVRNSKCVFFPEIERTEIIPFDCEINSTVHISRLAQRRSSGKGEKNVNKKEKKIWRMNNPIERTKIDWNRI